MLAGREASIDGQTIFCRSSRAGGSGGWEWRAGISRGGGALWRRGEHGHYLGTALAGDRERCTGPDGRPQAEVDFGRAPYLVAGADEEGFHLARAGGRTCRTWPQG